jgi:hypothetical protein
MHTKPTTPGPRGKYPDAVRGPGVPPLSGCKAFPASPRTWTASPEMGFYVNQVRCSLALVSPRRALVALLALTLVGLGFARMSNAELRRSTKAAHKTLQARRTQNPRPMAAAPGGPRNAASLTYVAPRPPLPRPASSLAPASLPSGSDALGTSVPRRKRWAMLGGHGRHGAG